LLNIQDNLQTKYTGGTVIHLFLGERIADPSAVPALVKKICENYRLPYFTLTPTFSICSSHGYVKGENRLCPTCHKECEVYSRVVGYLRPVSQWNEGKQAEFSMRQKFTPEFIEVSGARVEALTVTSTDSSA
jgi:ribonucleoside-triphosphate reductase